MTYRDETESLRAEVRELVQEHWSARIVFHPDGREEVSLFETPRYARDGQWTHLGPNMAPWRRRTLERLAAMPGRSLENIWRLWAAMEASE